MRNKEIEKEIKELFSKKQIKETIYKNRAIYEDYISELFDKADKYDRIMNYIKKMEKR